MNEFYKKNKKNKKDDWATQNLINLLLLLL